RGRPHSPLVEVRRVAEAERRVPALELLRTLEEADNLAVLGIRRHPVPGLGREVWRAGCDDRVEPLGHGAIRFPHRGDRGAHISFPVRLVAARARFRLQLPGTSLHRGPFVGRESRGRLASRAGALGRLLNVLPWAHTYLLYRCLGRGVGLRSGHQLAVLLRAAAIPADSKSRSMASAFSIRRIRVSGFFALSTARTSSRWRPSRRRASPARAIGSALRALAKCAGSTTTRGSGSNSSSTSTSSPVSTPAACRLALLRPSRKRPRMTATLLFHECPLIVIVTLGRLPWPSDSTTSGGTSNPLMCSGGSTWVRNFMISLLRGRRRHWTDERHRGSDPVCRCRTHCCSRGPSANRLPSSSSNIDHQPHGCLMGG